MKARSATGARDSTRAIESARNESSARRFWIAGILGIFSLQAVLWTAAIWLAGSDPSFAIIPEYEQLSRQWNERVQAEHASRKLGWTTEFECRPATETDGSAIQRLQVSIVDRDGQAVPDAHIHLVAFHRGRAAIKQRVDLEEIANGRYEARIQVETAGRWRFEGRAERGAEVYLFDTELYVSLPTGDQRTTEVSAVEESGR